MPEIVTCPNCSRKLRVPDDLLGKKVKCPDCKEPFLAQAESVSRDSAPGETGETPVRNPALGVSAGRRGAESESAPAPRIDDNDDEDHPDRRDEYDEDVEDDATGPVRAGWRSVRRGLSMLLWGIYTILSGLAVYLLCLAVAAILVVISGASFFNALTASTPSSSNNAGTAASTSFIIAIIVVVSGYVVYGLCWLTAFILQIIAHIQFLYIPNRPGTGRRGLAIAQTSLYCAMVVLPFASCAVYCLGLGAGSSMRNAGVMAGGMAGYYCGLFVAFLSFVAWFFVHMFYLRSVARAMGDHGLVRTLLMYMICYPTFLVLAFLSIIAVVCLGGAAVVSIASSSASAGGSGSGPGASLGGWLIAVVVVEVLVFLINIAMLIWYVVLLHQTRGSIARRLAE